MQVRLLHLEISAAHRQDWSFACSTAGASLLIFGIHMLSGHSNGRAIAGIDFNRRRYPCRRPSIRLARPTMLRADGYSTAPSGSALASNEIARRRTLNHNLNIAGAVVPCARETGRSQGESIARSYRAQAGRGMSGAPVFARS
jgi:hypothetical protein